MTSREDIETWSAELRESQERFHAEMIALEEIKRAHLRKVARALPEVPPRLAKYLAEPNVFLRRERSDGAGSASDEGSGDL